mgnify:CR=1 FL=1
MALPNFMIREDDWLPPVDDSPRWVGRWSHAEIADLVRRSIDIAKSDKLRDSDWKTFARVEAVILHAERSYSFFFDRMDMTRLLPDADCRPEPEDILGEVPSWENFVLVLGALHRCRAWIERIENRIGIASYPAIDDVIAAAFDGQPEPI